MNRACPFAALGLRLVAGLTEAGAQRIVAARRAAPFASVADLAHRARLDRRDLARLGDAGALAALAGHRHAAVWDVAGIERLPPLLAGSTFDEEAPALSAPTEGQDIVADYRTLGLTLRRHPLALLRDRLRRRRLSHRGRHRRSAARPHRAHRRHRHRPPAAGHRERRHVRHAGGRNGADQRDRLARSRRPAAARAPRRASCWPSTARSSARGRSSTCSPAGSPTCRRCWANCRPARGISTESARRAARLHHCGKRLTSGRRRTARSPPSPRRSAHASGSATPFFTAVISARIEIAISGGVRLPM